MVKNYLLIALATFIFTACNDTQRQQSQNHEGHSHEQSEHAEEEIAHFTAYTDSLEIYIVGNPIIAGKEVELTAHVTGM